MKNLIHKVKQFFNTKTAYQAALNRYISKYSPTSTAEVENLIKQFDRKHTGGLV